MTDIPDQAALREALADAAASHHDYEAVYLKGVRDSQWSGYYAAFVLGRLGGFAPASVLATCLEAAEGADWATAASDLVIDRLG